jgi:hypothetical protein
MAKPKAENPQNPERNGPQMKTDEHGLEKRTPALSVSSASSVSSAVNFFRQLGQNPY